MSETSTQSPTRPKAVRVVVLIGVSAAFLTVGLLLRIWNLQESLWLDELHTSWAIQEGLDSVLSRAAWGNQPPLYFWMQWIVCRSFGESEAVLRGLSLVSGMVLLPTLGCFAWRLCRSASLSLVVMLLASIDPDLAFYAQEARPYAFIQWLGTLHLLLLIVRLERPPGSRSKKQEWALRIGWMVTFLLAFYAHYTAAILLGVEAIVVGLVSAGQPESSKALARQLLVDMMLVCMMMLPATVHVGAVASRGDDWSVLMVTWPLPVPITRAWMLYGLPAVTLAATGGILRRLSRKWALQAPNPRPRWCQTWIWGIALALPVGACWLSARMEIMPLFLPRYLMTLLPVAILLPVIAAQRQFSFGGRAANVTEGGQRRFMGWLVLSLIVGFAMFENPLLNAPWPHGKSALQRGENWRFALSELPNPKRDDALLFLFPNLVEDAHLVDDRDAAFEAYASFPLHALYPLTDGAELGDSWKVIPRSTIRAPRLREEDVARLVEQGEARLIVRGSVDVATAILDEFADVLRPHGFSFDALVDVYGTVIVIELTLREI